MPKKEYVIKLTDEERTTVIAHTKKGTLAASKLARVYILRLADEGKQDANIVEVLSVGLWSGTHAQKVR